MRRLNLDLASAFPGWIGPHVPVVESRLVTAVAPNLLRWTPGVDEMIIFILLSHMLVVWLHRDRQWRIVQSTLSGPQSNVIRIIRQDAESSAEGFKAM